MHDSPNPANKFAPLPDDPTLRDPHAGTRALRGGIREAAEWYDFKNLKMVVGGRGGEVRHVPAREVLDQLDERDRLENGHDHSDGGANGAR